MTSPPFSLRFVILRHETPPGYARPTHWDFMLEREGGLWTWAVAEEPASGRSLAATRLKDHRVSYLDYEGEVSGGRGQVSRWDHGSYELISNEEIAASGHGPAELRIRLHGERIAGEVTLTRRQETADQWWFLWKGN